MANVRLLFDEIASCTLCKRLVEYRRSIKPPPRFRAWEYWNRPVPGFGDESARVLIVGLAPAAHGGNRTGRVFTGDESGRWVIRGLYELGLTNKEEGVSADDGLEVKEVYLTNAVKCAPPDNRPTREEIANCSRFLREELMLLPNVKVILALGRVAFEAVLSLYGVRAEFRHGASVELPDGKVLIASYHPSAQNTRTGRLSWGEWLAVLRSAYEIARSRS